MNTNLYSHLGARSKYYLLDQPETKYTNLAEAGPEEKIIDTSAVLGVLMKNYILANRTIVQGVNRTPWMFNPEANSADDKVDLPRHGQVKMSPQAIAQEMQIRLQREALAFLENKTKVGILLSGGMDSRVVAAVVKRLQECGDFRGDVVALSWGIEGCRDVEYAREVALNFGWEFRHFPLNAEVLKRNITLAAIRGAEYSPVHLHAMEAVSHENDLDGVLAGSYGDSIGRGEYSGKRIADLPDILNRNLNQFSFMLKAVEREALAEIKRDLSFERARFPGRSELEYREIELQMHYMRRQLNACMEVIDDQVPLYQMFSAPDVFGFMWSLDASCRTDDNYEYLLKLLPGDLLSIPWARTGAMYNQKGAAPEDRLSSLNNHYGSWLRNELREEILDEIGSGGLHSLGIFNQRSFRLISRNWPKSRNPKSDRLDEKMAWLASLSIFVKKYNIQGEIPKANYSIFDTLSEARAIVYTKAYHLALKVLK